ncbi:hypothetical protein [Arthrobacter sp. CJ23]|uniref:hypothetical protein n=1 Tax=Arthrobacter sp. CJ23 TaxID=2972479 RepID=UPI00215C7A1A|nr:hypothetical protein [Arthrobacter sp. CJ23]UVJ40286.1 hypothetical protein NVV90_03605 [Arthrobacter sp. CJ23]
MRSTTRAAAFSTIVFALASIVWFVLEGTPQRLGFEDTDDPALMVAFIQQHPEVFIQAGTMLIVMAASLTVAVLAVAQLVGSLLAPSSGAVGLRATSTFGLFAAAFFLFGGGVRIGSSGPLLHMAGLRPEWGEGAYLAAQVVSQAVLIGGILALCLWAVGLSLIGLRTKALPLPLCILGVLPAFRIVSSILGALGLLPGDDILWVLGMASIVGTVLWCLVLGLVLLRRGFGPTRARAGTARADI